MIMMVVIVKAVQMVELLAVAVKTAKTANMIGRLTDLNAAIRHGVSMALIVRPYKVPMAGIAPVVVAQVMQRVNVVMVLATVMKTVKAALQTVANVATVRMDI